jgi:molybdate transport system regulatory protein
VQILNTLFERPLVSAQKGGRKGGSAQVTSEGRILIGVFHAVEGELVHVVERLERTLNFTFDEI